MVFRASFSPSRVGGSLPAPCSGFNPELPHTAIRSRFIGCSSCLYIGGVSQASPLDKGWGQNPRSVISLIQRPSAEVEPMSSGLHRPRYIPSAYYESWGRAGTKAVCCPGWGPQPFTPPCSRQVRVSAQAFNPGLLCVACGSYRRGKVTCGDVDVLITHPDGRSHQGIFSPLLDSLRQQGTRSVFG